MFVFIQGATTIQKNKKKPQQKTVEEIYIEYNQQYIRFLHLYRYMLTV